MLMLYSPISFPFLCQLSTIVLILSLQYLMSGSAKCLPIDSSYFTGYFLLFIATIQGFRHCLIHTFNWITSFEFCRHVMNMLMQALTHMDPNCLKYWAYCWSKLQAISPHQKKHQPLFDSYDWFRFPSGDVLPATLRECKWRHNAGKYVTFNTTLRYYYGIIKCYVQQHQNCSLKHGNLMTGSECLALTF